MTTDAEQAVPSSEEGFSPWRIIGWVCAGVVVASVIACVAIAALRSEGLTALTITVLDPESEIRDHNIPIVNQKEALPDYDLTVYLEDGRAIDAGARYDTSAADGITWTFTKPISVADVAYLRLIERDKVMHDVIAEVQLTGETIEMHGYEFVPTTERSFAVGIASFFGTPIGVAISSAFFLAVLLTLLRFVVI